METAECLPGEPLRPIAEDREVTRLGAAVYRDGEVSPEAMDHTTRVLSRMAATLRENKVLTFRAVATSAVRDCRNQDEFLMRVQQALGGVPAEIISGQEEARLIQMGVYHRSPETTKDSLIIDIGGGSAEVIETCDGEISTAFSKPLGAVRLTEMFFHADPPTPAEIRKFRDYVREKAEAFRPLSAGSPNRQVIATAATAAATMRAIHEVPSSEKDSVQGQDASVEQIWTLFDELSTVTLHRRRMRSGINSRRAEIIVAGCGTLAMILEAVGARKFMYSAAGVRDGIIADLMIRREAQRHARLDSDQRRTVRRMAERYGVSMKHADQVARLAGELFDGLESVHGLEPHWGGVLEAAAYLHDIGHFVSSTRHHRHSYYVVANSDLPAFTERERIMIANLCRYHRKNMPKPNQENYKALDDGEKRTLHSLLPLLRLADNLDRGQEQRVRKVAAAISDAEIVLTLAHSGDIELEIWAAAQQAGVFEQAYGRRLTARAGMNS
jgi:exopolyphosphatase / guanosine-5'-triphosphate,3'-diphosphate pyrophosphatase